MLLWQGVHQTHKLASCQDEGTSVLTLGDFLLLAPVVGFLLQVVPLEQGCLARLDQGIASP
jgi:hypothetical protein